MAQQRLILFRAGQRKQPSRGAGVEYHGVGDALVHFSPSTQVNFNERILRVQLGHHSTVRELKATLARQTRAPRHHTAR